MRAKLFHYSNNKMRVIGGDVLKIEPTEPEASSDPLGSRLLIGIGVIFGLCPLETHSLTNGRRRSTCFTTGAIVFGMANLALAFYEIYNLAIEFTTVEADDPGLPCGSRENDSMTVPSPCENVTSVIETMNDAAKATKYMTFFGSSLAFTAIVASTLISACRAGKLQEDGFHLNGSSSPSGYTNWTFVFCFLFVTLAGARAASHWTIELSKPSKLSWKRIAETGVEAYIFASNFYFSCLGSMFLKKIRLALRDMADSVKQASTPGSIEYYDLSKMPTTYCHVYKACLSFNSIMGSRIALETLVHSMMNILHSFVLVSFLAEAIADPRQFKKGSVAWFSALLTVYTAPMLVVNYSAQSVVDEDRKLRNDLRCLLKASKDPTVDFRTRGGSQNDDLEGIKNILDSDSISITANDYFELGKATLINIGGTILTYLIILLEFKTT